jgi:hypothetical protein
VPKAFQQLDFLITCFRDLGATRIFCKHLAENDNTKQQIYLGGSFEVLKLLVFGEIVANDAVKIQNFKAEVPLWWVDGDGHAAPASGAKLILYPQYPEIRLSGFLKGCALAPSEHMQPAPADKRRFNNGADGRILVFGVSSDKVFAHLVLPETGIAQEIHHRESKDAINGGIFREIAFAEQTNMREKLLSRLRDIHQAGWHPSMKLDRHGNRTPFVASNGGGYTLEALLGVIPNGRSAPDFEGWEIKAYSGGKITLMTPEPDAGYYGVHGVEAFLRKYGRQTREDSIYFTGIHKAEIRSVSGHLLTIEGFDQSSGKIVNVNGSIRLLDEKNNISAEWTFGRLIKKWSEKHAAAAYVSYERVRLDGVESIFYRYNSPVLLGVGTAFEMFLQAMISGSVIFDPAPKLTGAGTSKTKVKARSQFRISVINLYKLYEKMESVQL